MQLKLYNTLTRTKEAFEPLDPARVRMYVCGPTVYDFAHIGNARPLIVFDVLYRLLRHLYGEGHVKYVRNVTDVDDKINARAAERGIAIRELTEETYGNFKEDAAALGCLPPTIEPRATEHIEEMKALIERLIAAGNAYVAEDHVLFHVASMPDYGKLAHRTLDEMMAGARVEVAPYKRDPMDFVLWKPSKPADPAWPSPGGIATPGRPGWHIECSAMSWKHLGETFDIHGGGIDLVFPHHENEIAQSRCAFHTPVMARFWMHNGFLQVEGEKMSKSLDNFVTIHDLLGEWTGQAMRFAMLQTNYRQPIDWTAAKLVAARGEIGHWVALFSGSEAHTDYQDRKFRKIPPQPSPELIAALADDLNTPKAIAVLREQFSSRDPMEGLGKQFFQDCEFLGLLDPKKIGALEGENVSGSIKPQLLFEAFPTLFKLRAGIANSRPDVVEKETSALKQMGISPKFMQGSYIELKPLTKDVEIDIKKIEELVAGRIAARKTKNFKESDRIRDELAKMGIELKDNKDGTTTWEVAR